MLLGIDHVVLATDDLDAVAADLENRLGLAASGGGRHEALGTVNRLIWLGDSYLELVAVVDPELAAQSWFGRPVLASLERGGGLVTWAIAVSDLGDAIRWAPPDADLEGPIDGERKRDDGRVVRWRLARPDVVSPTAPFLIEHDATAAEWTPAERDARRDETQPMGGRARLEGLEIETSSPAVAAGRIRRLLAASVEPAGRATVRVRLGHQEARFAAVRPRSPALVDVLADVPLRTRTARVGDCEIRVRGLPAAPVAGPHPEEAPGV